MSQRARDSASAGEVVVTGIGLVSPVGGDASSTMKALLAGESGVELLADPAREQSPVHVHAPVSDTALTGISRQERRRLDRSSLLALQAAREAWKDAGEPEVESDRLASVISTGVGGLLTIFSGYDRFLEKGYAGMPVTTVPALMPNSSAALIAIEYGARAAAVSLASACASGADALAHALRLFRDDEIDMAIVGGTEAVIHPVALSAFGALRALSTSSDPSAASRPFDRDRDGFVLGEGAAIMVVERRRHAIARGARIWGKLLGAGSTCDATHLVAPDPTGEGSAKAIRKALRSAELAASDVTFVSAHATSTPPGDLAEWRALRDAFGSSLPDIGVTAVKSAIGHLVGASGAVGAAVTAMSLYQGQIPPTQNLDNLDQEIELDVVQGAPRSIGGGAALVNSSGFGGHNVAIVMASD